MRESAVDFLATASYKWLMGDFGLGFLYVRQDVLGKPQRTQWSFRQFQNFDYHAFPGDPAGSFPASYEQRQDAAGFFEVGTYARLRAEMPRLGYPCITPDGSRGAIIAFAVKDDAATAARLRVKEIDVGISRGRIRVSPSVYNTEHDVEALLEALI